MKKKVLVILGNYITPSSVAINIKPFLKDLEMKGYEIDIVTNGDRKECYSDEIGNIYTTNNMLGKLMMLRSNNFVLHLILRFFQRMFSFFRYRILSKILSEVRYLEWSKTKTVKLCDRLNKKNKYDFILSVSLPFKSNEIAFDFVNKHRGVKWYMFLFDPYSYNTVENPNLFKKKIAGNKEKKYLDVCDKIFLTPELFDFYIQNELNKYSKKMISIPYGTLEYNEFNEVSEIDEFVGNIVCLYSGRLYSDIRNPDKMIQIFKKLSNLNLYVITDYKETKFIRDCNESANINLLSMKDHKYGLSALKTANVLISIGNKVAYQVPGKIFELISSGKPIIHFTTGEFDEALKYLKLYPLCLVINTNTVNDEILSEISNFCSINKDKKLSKNEIKEYLKIYYADNAKALFSNQF